ncbi:MAG TPA: hypothetical protein EYG73_01320 [Arcobacter sp.]|nr:hypothetical protein [Arcobacter sp.]
MKIVSLVVLFILLFSACSSKKYFEPKDTHGSIDAQEIVTPAYISNINAIGGTLDNNMIVDKVGISKDKLPLGFSFLNNINGLILAANKSKELLILDKNETLKFKSNVIAASLQDDLIALVFSNNSIGIYDNKNKVFKLKKYYKHSFLNDTRIAMPLFLNKIILFPTLDGKIIIVDKSTNKITKTLTVDPQSDVKNIILLKTINNAMIAASPNKIITLNNGDIKTKEFFIQSYTLDDEFIYIASLDGTIYKFDLSLNIINQKKFKFAKFQALAIGQYLYAVESQGFIIRLSKDFKDSKVYKFAFEEDEKMFAHKNKLYIENKLLILK